MRRPYTVTVKPRDGVGESRIMASLPCGHEDIRYRPMVDDMDYVYCHTCQEESRKDPTYIAPRLPWGE